MKLRSPEHLFGLDEETDMTVNSFFCLSSLFIVTG